MTENEYSLNTVLADLTTAVFVKNKELRSTSQNIQIEYVKRLIAIIGVNKASSYDNLAKTAELSQLMDIIDNASSMGFEKIQRGKHKTRTLV